MSMTIKEIGFILLSALISFQLLAGPPGGNSGVMGYTGWGMATAISALIKAVPQLTLTLSGKQQPSSNPGIEQTEDDILPGAKVRELQGDNWLSERLEKFDLDEYERLQEAFESNQLSDKEYLRFVKLKAEFEFLEASGYEPVSESSQRVDVQTPCMVTAPTNTEADGQVVVGAEVVGKTTEGTYLAGTVLSIEPTDGIAIVTTSKGERRWALSQLAVKENNSTHWLKKGVNAICMINSRDQDRPFFADMVKATFRFPASQKRLIQDSDISREPQAGGGAAAAAVRTTGFTEYDPNNQTTSWYRSDDASPSIGHPVIEHLLTDGVQLVGERTVTAIYVNPETEKRILLCSAGYWARYIEPTFLSEAFVGENGTGRVRPGSIVIQYFGPYRRDSRVKRIYRTSDRTVWLEFVPGQNRHVQRKLGEVCIKLDELNGLRVSQAVLYEPILCRNSGCKILALNSRGDAEIRLTNGEDETVSCSRLNTKKPSDYVEPTTLDTVFIRKDAQIKRGTAVFNHKTTNRIGTVVGLSRTPDDQVWVEFTQPLLDQRRRVEELSIEVSAFENLQVGAAVLWNGFFSDCMCRILELSSDGQAQVEYDNSTEWISHNKLKQVNWIEQGKKFRKKTNHETRGTLVSISPCGKYAQVTYQMIEGRAASDTTKLEFADFKDLQILDNLETTSRAALYSAAAATTGTVVQTNNREPQAGGGAAAAVIAHNVRVAPARQPIAETVNATIATVARIVVPNNNLAVAGVIVPTHNITAPVLPHQEDAAAVPNGYTRLGVSDGSIPQ
ncbi:MAG: hypothetical protein JKY15_07095 [Deltaproteobacteria bacterium]|nr:hypothetical protein [Deltaproteobacteria bacterium]